MSWHGADAHPGPSRQYPQDWSGFESLPSALAELICLSLVAAPITAPLRERLDRVFVLMAQGSPHPAADLLQECYAATGECLALHLLGYLEQSMDRDEIARVHLLAEQTCLAHDDGLGHAANAWQLGLLALKQRKLAQAEGYARECLELAQHQESPLTQGCAWRLLAAISPGQAPGSEAQPALEALSAIRWNGVRELDLRLATMVMHLAGSQSGRSGQPPLAGAA